MNTEKLCLNLAQCETEDEVIVLLKKEGLWDDDSAWTDFGENDNNFSTIGNQQSRPEAALVEKIINSVDAMLMSSCLSQHIDPTGKEAPRSIKEALIRFFKIRDGKLSNINPIERGRLAEDICLVATGAKSNPCYTIIDKGEGQSPDRMPHTILSTGKSNKMRIPFVQGKFHMGGTGVLRFCGRHNIQLIISKRNPAIARYETDETKNMWGFTIIRRVNPTGVIRSSIYRYLAPTGKILTFENKGIPVLPGKYPKPYGELLEWGTCIKLYEYQMVGLKTNILLDLYNRLSLLMPTIGLPIRLYERRAGYAGHTLETTLSGLTVRLDEDRAQNLEEGFPTSFSFSVMGQKMKASIFAFKRGQSEKYKKDEGIVFTINGQTHGYLSESFFSRREVGLGYLEDSLLVLIDCSEIDGRSREDLFMNNREKLCYCEFRSEIERNIEDILRNNTGLRELKTRRREEEIKDKLEDSKPLVDIIESILKKSPTLAKLFVSGTRLTNPFNTKKTKPKENYEGKKFPTLFKLIGEYFHQSPKICHINRGFRIQYKTDATNDYFDRDADPGTFVLKINDTELKDYSLNLWNGTATLTVHLPDGIKIGDILHFESKTTDINKVEPFEDEFWVRIEKEEVNNGGKNGKRKPPTESDGEGNEEGNSQLGLPDIFEVRRTEWSQHKFNEESALQVIANGEGYDFYVNIDNIHLLTEIKGNTSIDEKILVEQYKIGMVLIGIALLKDDAAKNENPESAEQNGDNVYKKIDFVTRVISPVLLPMISSLSELEVPEMKKAVGEE